MTTDSNTSTPPVSDLPPAIQVSDLVDQFGLVPHPEGGYYRETYRSGQTVLRTAAQGGRCASTAIYYLLDNGAYSAWHRIASDEIWHFYAGSPLWVHVLNEGGGRVSQQLGNALHTEGCVFQVVVPARCWFAAELVRPDSFALVGCTVAPGFEFSEFELASESDLSPWRAEDGSLIRRLLKQGAS